jgi:Fe-S cluster biogenesis protein NfuA
MMDGGNIELLETKEEEGYIKVKLTGACHGCPGARMTLENIVNQVLKKEIKEIKQIDAEF